MTLKLKVMVKNEKVRGSTMTILNPKYPRLSSGDTINALKPNLILLACDWSVW